MLVLDDQAEMAIIVGGLPTTLRERQELIAKIDEGHVLAFATQLEFQKLAVECQCLVDITDFQGNVIEAHCTGLSLIHRSWVSITRRLRETACSRPAAA